MNGLEPRDAGENDWPGIKLLTATSFGSFWHDETIAGWRTLMPARSSVVVSDGDDVVGMAHYLDFELTVPGGAVLPTAGVTWVGVAPTHRRRGLLRSIYTELHQRLSDAGYPFAALTASEGGIYGRFGYGVATVDTDLTVDRRFARFHVDAADPGGVRIVRPREHPDELAEIYDRFRRCTPGAIARATPLWDDLLADWEDSRGGATAWFCLLHADGYLLYRSHGRPRPCSRRGIQVRDARSPRCAVARVDRPGSGRDDHDQGSSRRSAALPARRCEGRAPHGGGGRALAAAHRIRGDSAEQLARLDVAFRSDIPAQIGFNF